MISKGKEESVRQIKKPRKPSKGEKSEKSLVRPGVDKK
uniref:Uncharacterized protein n=1 Tax=viral metagenome TaxID=1070528 RepID=A0A6C0F9I0_9ZZZZ|tara:strand:+ start:18902 stop:19015 length:114 start_codon:yes stop_codon:yes gene_type:complete